MVFTAACVSGESGRTGLRPLGSSVQAGFMPAGTQRQESRCDRIRAGTERARPAALVAALAGALVVGAWRATPSSMPRRPRRGGRAESRHVMTKINGQPAASPVQFQELTLSKKAGGTVDLEVWRSGQTASVTVTLGTQP